MKKYFITFFAIASLVFARVPARADEGMWLPSMISSVIGDMQSKGFRLSTEDVYSVNQASLKDAVVLFGSGCTGELISDEGLLITNHHCGYSWIQYHSSVENDYLRDGFWAFSKAQELPCPGLSVSFLDRMEDVTSLILKDCVDGMDEVERADLIEERSNALIKEVEEQGGRGTKAKIAALYYGNQYFLYVFRVYNDVRFVGAPPSSIGKFGGDTDNWMWPRHTGDFSLFRVYASAEDNLPAAYSAENVPYKPKRFFEISTAGVREGDFTFVYGCPGSTREYITSAAVDYTANVSNPAKIDLRTIRLDAMRRYMNADQAVRIQYSSKYASVSNAWKKWQGESKGLRKHNTVGGKKAYEAAFNEWAVGGPYEGVVDSLLVLQEKLDKYMFAYEYYRESIYVIEYTEFMRKTKGQPSAADSASFFKNYYRPIDEECFVNLVEAYGSHVPADLRPEYFDAQLARYENIPAWKDAVFASDSLALEFSKTFFDYYRNEVYPEISTLNWEIYTLMRTYMKAQMAFEPNKTFYPDANLTLRITYGKVSGYEPYDGAWYLPSSSIEGIMQKDNPDIFDYNIPQKLRDLYASKDYGRWEVNGSVPVCFLGTNHTTGGNSGSPIINADGRLIGLNFDRVWEGTMSDIEYHPDICRNVSIDIRYALFIIDKLAGAQNLIDEMVLVP